MIAHVIVNPYRPVPNTTLYNELDRQGIDAKIWQGIHDPNDVVRGIGLSHKQIVQFAVDHHLPQICIMEEDVWFPAGDGWLYFQQNIPKIFDLYLGGAYGLNQTALTRIQRKAGSVEVNNFAGLHCYIINDSYYEKFLSLPENKHIDDQPGMGKFYICAPMAALQYPGWSSNARRSVDYNCNKGMLPDECIYYGTQ
jgi:hypothetical protein